MCTRWTALTLAAAGVVGVVVVAGPVAGMAMAVGAGAWSEVVVEMMATEAETQSVVAIGTPVVMAVDMDVVVGIPADLMVFE